MFSDEDLTQIGAHDLSVEEIERQIDLFRNPPGHIRIDRPCTVNDGIHRLTEAEVQAALSEDDTARGHGRLLKMVPASGAATRMFQALLHARNTCVRLTRTELAARAEKDEELRTAIAFADGVDRFAFFVDLCATMARDGMDARDLARRGEFASIFEYLLTPRGLDYASLPKGLLRFHHDSEGSRTPVEEHLVEAAECTRDAAGVCCLHFTVSEEHSERFAAHLEEVRPRWETRLAVRYRAGFSTQRSSTDTIAVDEQNRPFRTAEGHLLFRPGGHGALIGNLNDLRGDLIHLSNIDNVVPDRLKAPVIQSRRVLAGYLSALQRRAHGHIEALLRSPANPADIDAAARFVREDLGLDTPGHPAGDADAARRGFLLALLDRPMRVCGMVENVGEPGGGPFWVRGEAGGWSRQIVERAQVDPDDAEQQRVFAAATHFNPVDLVCAVRNHRGDCFDLARYVDPDAVFISRKSHEGRGLKALEHPGLWNGAMSHWTTVFVEIPLEVFNPVKTVLDLLRPQHQPG